MDLSFRSEALGMPADKGHGCAQLDFGETIGGDQRYTIVRKLGWGGVLGRLGIKRMSLLVPFLCALAS